MLKNIAFSANMEESLEILQALSEEGLVIVPLKPTVEMVKTAQKLYPHLSEQDIQKIYFAMTSVVDEEGSDLFN